MCMSERIDETSNSEETNDDVPYYLPGAPQPSREPGRVSRFLENLLRRRGSLVPVTRPRRRD